MLGKLLEQSPLQLGTISPLSYQLHTVPLTHSEVYHIQYIRIIKIQIEKNKQLGFRNLQEMLEEYNFYGKKKLILNKLFFRSWNCLSLVQE
jgi:hypothetical protein